MPFNSEESGNPTGELAVNGFQEVEFVWNYQKARQRLARKHKTVELDVKKLASEPLMYFGQKISKGSLRMIL